MVGIKYPLIAAGAALAIVAAAVPFMDLPVRTAVRAPDVMSVLHKRSPEQRVAGALTTKRVPKMAMLSDAASPAKAPPVPRVGASPARVPVAAPIPPAVAKAPVLFAPPVVPVAPVIPATFVPAAPGSSFFIPPIIIPGGGGDTLPPLVPPGAVVPPAPVPGVPEPGTWAMMIIGFGLLGVFLRRRRLIEGSRSPATGRIAFATGPGQGI